MKRVFIASGVVIALLGGCRGGCDIDDDQVYIDAAIQIYIKNHREQDRPSDAARGGKYIPYQTIEEFRLNNPDCCVFSYIEPESWHPPWYLRWYYDYAGTVVMRVNERVEQDGGIVLQRRATDYVFRMNSCAEAIPHMKF